MLFKKILFSTLITSSLFSQWNPTENISDGLVPWDPMAPRERNAYGQDASGNVLAIWGSAAEMSSVTVEYSYWPSGGTPSAPADIPMSSSSEFLSPDLSVAPDGTAWAIWIERAPGVSGDFSVKVSKWTSGSWSTPEVLMTAPSTLPLLNPKIDMNSSGEAVAVYATSTASIFSHYFTGGSWGSSQALVSGVVPPTVVDLDVSINDSGIAAAVWQLGSGGEEIFGSYRTGGTWSGPGVPIQLSSGTVTSSEPRLGIKNDGNVIISWIENDGANLTVRGLDWDGMTATPGTTPISTAVPVVSVDIGGLDLSVDKTTGLAAAIWTVENTGSGLFSIESNFYDGMTWLSMSEEVVTPNTSPLLLSFISINSSGKALAIWTSIEGSAFVNSSSLWDGSQWNFEEVFFSETPPSGTLIDQDLFYNNQENRFAGFIIVPGGPPMMNIYGAMGEPSTVPTPPRDLAAEVLKNTFLTQIECINVLTWKASLDSNVVGYRIYKGSQLLGQTQADQLSFTIREVITSPNLYSVIAFNASGEESPPVSVEVP